MLGVLSLSTELVRDVGAESVKQCATLSRPLSALGSLRQTTQYFNGMLSSKESESPLASRVHDLLFELNNIDHVVLLHVMPLVEHDLLVRSCGVATLSTQFVCFKALSFSSSFADLTAHAGRGPWPALQGHVPGRAHVC
jgi:hypothetical protein